MSFLFKMCWMSRSGYGARIAMEQKGLKSCSLDLGRMTELPAHVTCPKCGVTSSTKDMMVNERVGGPNDGEEFVDCPACEEGTIILGSI
eukprot:g82637.t1